MTTQTNVKGKRSGVSTDLVLTLDDAARMMGVSLSTTYAAAREGKIPTVRFGRRWLVPRAKFERMLSGEEA